MFTCTGRAVRATLTAVALSLLGWSAAPQAAFADEPPRSPGEYYAAELAALPEGEAVFLSDSLVGRYRLPALKKELRAEFSRLDVPFYVIAGPLPSTRLRAEQVLSAVHDRSGADGLYVYLQPAGGTVEAVAYGVDVPADDATAALLYSDELDYDASIGQTAEAFVTAALDPRIEQRVAQQREEYSTDSGDGVWESFTAELDPATYNGPANLGFLAGVLAGAVATIGLLAAWRLRAAATAGDRRGTAARARARRRGGRR